MTETRTYEKTGIVLSSSRGYDVLKPAELLAGENRTLLCNTEITNESVNDLITKLLYLDSISNEMITILISSPGGSIDAGMALYDVMQIIKSPIRTIAVGFAYSMGAIILTAGTKGERFALEHSRIMIHEPRISNGGGGTTSRIKDLADDMMKTKIMLDKILVKHTNQSLRYIEKNTSYDNYLTAQEAVKFGLIDGIINEGGQLYGSR